MFSQTHVYFAHRVLGRINDAVVMGSIFPDMSIGVGVNREVTHSSGKEILEFLRQDDKLLDFALANITHGVKPDGLDYYSDETNPPFEKGYCFEKARPIINDTIAACNIPPEMGWWKAHNIIEMGVELIVSSSNDFSYLINDAFNNSLIIEYISNKMGIYYSINPQKFIRQINSFPALADLDKTTPISLAKKYDVQMYNKHGININIHEVARLVDLASEMVSDDLEDFFRSATEIVRNRINSLI